MKKNEKKLTANEFTNVKDIKETYLYTKDGYLMMYIRIHNFNIDLLPIQEKKSKATNLAASFETEKKDFVYFSYPREIDLDDYKISIKSKYNQESQVGLKRILELLLDEANELATKGENYEHQHFIKIWNYIGNRELRDVKNELKQRANDFVERYKMIGVKGEIIESTDIIKLCNLFANAAQASFEVQPDLCYGRMNIMR